MRYIDNSIFNPPDDWLTLAKQDVTISSQSLWSFLKHDLENICGKKCWYSECDVTGSDNPVDHFRPKASYVKPLPDVLINLLSASVYNQLDNSRRVGYKFLEYEHTNYRYSCSIVNSHHKKETPDGITRGKQNFFPIKINTTSATTIDQVNYEDFCLLDPCVLVDPSLLTFTESGTIEPHISLLKNSWNYSRVKVTIEVYHLHYYRFIEKRKIVWNDCKANIEMANALYLKRRKNDLDVISLTHHLKQINSMIKKTSTFSSTAIDCVIHYKQVYKWLDSIFDSSKLVK